MTNRPASADHGFPYEERASLLRSLGVEATFLGVGVDRVDYTKGILERFLAMERFLEKYPTYQGKFTFVQIGAPSRTHIKRYHDLLAEVEAEAERINWRFQSEQVETHRVSEAAAQPQRDRCRTTAPPICAWLLRCTTA